MLEGRLRIAGAISSDPETRGACDDFVDADCWEKDSVDDSDDSGWVLEFEVGFTEEEEVALSEGRKPSATIIALRS